MSKTQEERGPVFSLSVPIHKDVLFLMYALIDGSKLSDTSLKIQSEDGVYFDPRFLSDLKPLLSQIIVSLDTPTKPYTLTSEQILNWALSMDLFRKIYHVHGNSTLQLAFQAKPSHMFVSKKVGDETEVVLQDHNDRAVYAWDQFVTLLNFAIANTR